MLLSGVFVSSLFSFPTRRSSDLQPARYATHCSCSPLVKWTFDLCIPAGVVVCCPRVSRGLIHCPDACQGFFLSRVTNLVRELDRKSTRLNSSHPSISYDVFCCTY